MPVVLMDSSGDTHQLQSTVGEPLFSTLLRNHVPPASVLVTRDGEPISIFRQVSGNHTDYARLLERYDIRRISDLYAGCAQTQAAETYRRLSLDDENISDNRRHLTVEELSGAVEKRLLDVVERYNLFKNDRIVVAYSGGIDSSALLAALASVYPELSVEIRTVTLENYWKENKVETKQGQNQADLFPPGVRETLDLSHTEISVTEIESVYGLNRPLPGVLREFNQQDLRLDTVSAANSINRRLFERHANRCGTDRICVGDHSTDIIAGIIGSLLTSAPLYRGQFPEHQIGKFSYIFPLAFHTKRELALYLQAHTGKTIEHTGFDPWEMNTAARHFYYYLADILQSFCPGLIYRLRDRSQDNLITDTQSCDNCGKIKIPSDLIDGRCEVCDAFGRIGAI